MSRLPRRSLCALALVLLGSVAARAGEPDLIARLRGPRVAAHRGTYGAPGANTIAGFEAARRQGADIVETDLRVSKDGVVFLFHDELLDRETVCRGPLASHTSDELARCRLRGLDRGPDRFEDALRWSGGRVVIDAELKTPDAARPAIDLVRRHAAFEWVYFQVGDGLGTYRRVRDYDARAALEAGPRSEKSLAALLAANDSRLVLIQLRPGFLSEGLVSRVRASGKLTSLNAWLLAPERGAASCDRAFALRIDVAVTNAAGDCAKQRDGARAGLNFGAE
jgi:glycerophosphoryl diester phosphodiesterase